METCEARRAGRGDGDCDGPVKWQVVTRTSSGKVMLRVPGCFRHCLAEVDRANAAGGMARCDMEPLDVADGE